MYFQDLKPLDQEESKLVLNERLFTLWSIKNLTIMNCIVYVDTTTFTIYKGPGSFVGHTPEKSTILIKDNIFYVDKCHNTCMDIGWFVSKPVQRCDIRDNRFSVR